jgi:adenylate cyclase
VDVVRVKGKQRGVAIFELVGPVATLPAAARDRLAAWDAAMADYRGRRFEAARQAFAALTAAGPGDEVARLYLGRCDEALAHPPPADWDGVHELHEK